MYASALMHFRAAVTWNTALQEEGCQMERKCAGSPGIQFGTRKLPELVTIGKDRMNRMSEQKLNKVALLMTSLHLLTP